MNSQAARSSAPSSSPIPVASAEPQIADAGVASEHYSAVATAIRFLRDHCQRQPQLVDVAREVGVSPSHLQRTFSQWAGVSPKRFTQVLSSHYARDALRGQASVLDASYAAGLSSPGRLHDLCIQCDAMTPGEISSRGKGLALTHGWGFTPFGVAFIAWSDRGICHLAFHDAQARGVVTTFKADWHGAQHHACDDDAQVLLNRVFTHPLKRGELHLLLRGTNFQVKVWEALLRVGPGDLLSYGDLAGRAGNPKASRAVGSAMARNRIAYLIPCHRVIRESGDWGSYRWGLDRKVALHVWESAP